MRLYDRLLANERTPEYVREGLQRATVVVADNVAAYYWSGTDQDYWDVEQHFPNVAPPYPVMWIETTAPNQIRLPQQVQGWDERMPRGWAVLRRAVDLRSLHDMEPEEIAHGCERLDVVIENHMQRMRPILEKAYRASGGDPARGMETFDEEGQRHMRHLAALVKAREGLRDGSTNPAAEARSLVAERGLRWMISDWIFLDHPAYGCYPAWSYLFYVGADGSFQRVAEDSWYQAGPLCTPPMERLLRDSGIHDIERLNGGMVSLWHTSLLTVSFMHCRNVVRTLVDPVQQWRARHPKKKGYAPAMVKYYVLDIDPMKEVLRREGRSESEGIPRAMHFCRGHFVHYTEEAPLFGKYTGRFWRPMHVRGSAEHGEVVKDYQVLAPTEGSTA